MVVLKKTSNGLTQTDFCTSVLCKLRPDFMQLNLLVILYFFLSKGVFFILQATETLFVISLYCSLIEARSSLQRRSYRCVKSPMLVVVPYLSVSHGYLSCTNTDDALHTHTLFTHLSEKRCLYLGAYDGSTPLSTCSLPWNKWRNYTGNIDSNELLNAFFQMWILDFA